MSALNIQLSPHPRTHNNQEKMTVLETSILFPKIQSINDKHIILNQNADEDALDEETMKKKNENKQRYRRLKQKLASLCSENQQKCLFKTSKQVSSSNKARLLTLAIQFQKITLNQTKDYHAIENKLREIHKILDLKLENDLIILKQSRFIPAFSALLKKVPTFHKNQFLQSLKALQSGFKVLRLFCTLAANRDYLISVNQLSTLNSCLNCFISKEEKKLSIQCLNVILELLCNKIKVDSEQIINITLQIVFFGQLARRLRQTIELGITEEGLVQAQYVLKCLKYLHILYSKCFEKCLERPLYQQPEIPQIMQFHIDCLLQQLYQAIPILLLDKDQGCLKQQQLPVCQINVAMYILKLLNICIHANVILAQKCIDISEKSPFCLSIKCLYKYSYQNIQNSTGNHQLNSIFSQITDLLGKICCQFEQNRDNLFKTGLIQMLYNHPIVYIMDPKLKSILIPSLCSVMNRSEKNMKEYLSENSAQNIINYIIVQKRWFDEWNIKKNEESNLKQLILCEDMEEEEEINNSKLGRKQSVSSLNSFTTQCTQSYMPLTDEHRTSYGLYFVVPLKDWDQLVDRLRVLDC